MAKLLKTVKARRLSLVLSLLCLLAPSSALASLITMEPVAGQRVVYDDATWLYWYPDLSRFNRSPKTAQQADIDDLNSSSYAQISDWRFATLDEFRTLYSYLPADPSTPTSFDLSEYFVPSYVSDPLEDFWGRLGTEVGPGPGTSYVGELAKWASSGDFRYQTWEYDYFPDLYSHPNFGAWVVSSTAPVPEPATLLLLGSGLLGLAARRRRSS